MRSSKLAVLAGAMALAPAAAAAADMPFLEAAPVIEEFGGWYLRGDIGMTNQSTSGLYNVLMETADQVTFLDKGRFDSGWLFGLGIGYQVNNWLRADITGEYRGRTAFRALDRYDIDGDGVWDGTDDYSATKSEWLVLANAYVDLGRWWHITPFIGAGIGAARVTVGNYRDVNVPNLGVAYADDHSDWNLAWALHAGLAYQVSPAFTVELAYRYLSLGDGMSGDVMPYDGPGTIYNPTTFRDLTSHDVKLAMRWNLGVREPAQPLVRKY